MLVDIGDEMLLACLDCLFVYLLRDEMNHPVPVSCPARADKNTLCPPPAALCTK